MSHSIQMTPSAPPIEMVFPELPDMRCKSCQESLLKKTPYLITSETQDIARVCEECFRQSHPLDSGRIDIPFFHAIHLMRQQQLNNELLHAQIKQLNELVRQLTLENKQLNEKIAIPKASPEFEIELPQRQQIAACSSLYTPPQTYRILSQHTLLINIPINLLEEWGSWLTSENNLALSTSGKLFTKKLSRTEQDLVKKGGLTTLIQEFVSKESRTHVLWNLMEAFRHIKCEDLRTMIDKQLIKSDRLIEFISPSIWDTLTIDFNVISQVTEQAFNRELTAAEESSITTLPTLIDVLKKKKPQQIPVTEIEYLLRFNGCTHAANTIRRDLLKMTSHEGPH